jgi:hypothetical protein
MQRLSVEDTAKPVSSYSGYGTNLHLKLDVVQDGDLPLLDESSIFDRESWSAVQEEECSGYAADSAAASGLHRIRWLHNHDFV